MRLGSALALAVGLALLALVIEASDPRAAIALLATLPPSAALWVLALFALAWAAEIQAWALTFTARPVTPRWYARLWLVNMVGEALNVVMPFGALGGEPVKAWLLKRHHAVSYREAGATLVLMQALLAIAEALFVAVGAALAAVLGLLPPAMAQLLYLAAACLTVAMTIALLGLRLRWLRALLAQIESRLARARHRRWLAALGDIEHTLADFARVERRRLVASTGLYLVNWLGGAAEVWLMLELLNAALPFAHCWVAEAAIVTIRSLTFFLPAQLGSVEAVTVWVVAALGGSAESGLALAALRRARELAWAALGLGVGAAYRLEWRTAPRD